jgi:hypothetical protein
MRMWPALPRWCHVSTAEAPDMCGWLAQSMSRDASPGTGWWLPGRGVRVASRDLAGSQAQARQKQLTVLRVPPVGGAWYYGICQSP